VAADSRDELFAGRRVVVLQGDGQLGRHMDGWLVTLRGPPFAFDDVRPTTSGTSW